MRENIHIYIYIYQYGKFKNLNIGRLDGKKLLTKAQYALTIQSNKI